MLTKTTSKKKRRPRKTPETPKWFCVYEYCYNCKHENNCSQCKVARDFNKYDVDKRIKGTHRTDKRKNIDIYEHNH